MTHRIIARRPGEVSPPHIDRDPAIVASFLSDAAHVPGGFAAGVAFPRSEAEVAALVRDAGRVLPVGAQSSLTGGATPRGDLVLSTRALSRVGPAIVDRPEIGRTIRVGAGVPLTTLQASLTASGLYYPPVPTYDGAFVGGTIATNAAGAATFKYGSTRPWVAAITVVLANGDVLDIARGDVTASPERLFDVELTSGRTVSIVAPSYHMPDVAKLSAGYYARPGMDLIDLFIGSEGTLGIVVEATLRVIPRPRRAVALIQCGSDDQAVAVTAALRRESPVSAIEYMDARALRVVADEVFVRAGVTRPMGESVLLMVQIEVGPDAAGDEGAELERLQAILDSCEVTDETTVAAPDDDRSAQRLFELREAVPASVNAIVAAAKTRAHPDIEKTAGDMVVPFARLAESLALYRHAFESRGLEYAIWGHVSDGNLHPNLIPRTYEDMIRGREALVDIARGVIGMDGAPLAEHGVGRSALKQRLLRELYGDQGIEQMRAVKRALDPEWKLAPGVVFPA